MKRTENDITNGKMDYYKSLVTDEEVVQALVKESKAREGELEKTRIRPNMNFFQRTVSNLVSTNTRIAKRHEEVVAREKDKYRSYRRKEAVPVRRKTHVQLINEILSDRIEFVSESNSKNDVDISLTPGTDHVISTGTDHVISTGTDHVISKDRNSAESDSCLTVDSDLSDDVELISFTHMRPKCSRKKNRKKKKLSTSREVWDV